MVRGHAIVPRFGKRVTDVLKGMLRPALIPAKGNVLIVADWSAIEGRVQPVAVQLPGGRAPSWTCFAQGRGRVQGQRRRHLWRGSRRGQRATSVRSARCKSWPAALPAALVPSQRWAAPTASTCPSPTCRRMVDAWRRANPWSVPYWQPRSAYTRAMRNKGHEFSRSRCVLCSTASPLVCFALRPCAVLPQRQIR
jgi:hypothetical protein